VKLSEPENGWDKSKLSEFCGTELGSFEADDSNPFDGGWTDVSPKAAEPASGSVGV
jgi:hypothetical protein